MNYADIVICLAGVALLAYWLLKTSLGRQALADSSPRRNNMKFYLPLVPFFFSFGAVALAAIIAGDLTKDWPAWQSAIADNVVICVGTTLTVILIIILARAHFARRLKGFGLNLRALPRDILAAPLYLLAVQPLILVAIKLTVDIAKRFSGPEYQLQQHQQLELVAQHPEMMLRVLIFVVAAIIIPLFEELMFRGLIQTMLRSFLRTANGAWVAIALSSGLFALMHEDPAHWPALFILGACMGYAYEKSGSLWRPIFIHAIFNGMNVIATMSG